MIEARTQSENATPKANTPEIITTSMIIEDLENGIDRKGIQTKYNLEGWELTEMFKHPVLKGKKAKKKRKMSFNFVDDTTQNVDPNQTSIPTTENTIADDFHNRADLRTQDAIENTTVVDTGETVLGYTAEQVEELNSEEYSKEMSLNEVYHNEEKVEQPNNPLNS
jgi:hypothetical protein